VQLLLIDSKPDNPNAYLVRAVYAALQRNPSIDRVDLADYATALKRVTVRQYDALLVFGGEEADNPVIRRLCAVIPRRAVWFTEDPYELSRNLGTAEHFDCIFTNDPRSAAAYGSSASWLPLAADPEHNVFQATARLPRYDLFFAGTAWPNRLRFLRTLRQQMPDVRMKLVLVSNPALDPYIAELRGDFPFSGGIAIRDFSAFAGVSALTLVLGRHFSTSQTNQTGSDMPGPRLFEAAAAGACQLVDLQTLPGTRDLYREGQEFIGFTDESACLRQIESMLANPARWQEVADAAREKTLAAHLYDHRVAIIARQLAAIAPLHPPELTSRRPRVLFVSHNIVQFGHFGGGEIYLDEIRRHLKSHDAYILAHDSRSLFGIDYCLFDHELSVIRQIRLKSPCHRGLLSHGELEVLFQQILAEFSIDLVHINHGIGFPPSLPLVARALGVPVVYTLHDYYSICDNFNLLGHDHRYCRIAERPESTCDICQHHMAGLAPGSMARRRRFYREAFTAIDLPITVSGHAANIFRQMFPDSAERIRVLPPPLVALERLATPPDIRKEGLNVALLGNFTLHKGAELALQLFRLCHGEPIHFHLFGRVDAELVSALREYGGDAVSNHGAFSGGQIPDDFFSCHVALVASIWPETYCMTLSEAFRAGVVPIVTDIGAPSERVIDGQNGFVVPVGDAGLVASRLRECLAEPLIWQRLRDARPERPFTDSETVTHWLEEQYKNLIVTMSPRLTPAADRYLSLQELGIYFENPNWKSEAHALPVAAAGPLSPVIAVPWQHYAGRFLQIIRSHGVKPALQKARTKLYQIIRIRYLNGLNN
jgi:glycosyltransferase involved in cell wall biosynthesis